MTWPMYVPMLKKVTAEEKGRASGCDGYGYGGGGGRETVDTAAAMYREIDPHLDPHGLDYDENTGLDLDHLANSHPLPPPAVTSPLPPPAVTSRSVTAPASIGSPTVRPGSDADGHGLLPAAPPLERADSSQPRTIPDGKGGYTREAPYDASTR